MGLELTHLFLITLQAQPKVQEVYEQHPTLHGCDLSISTEEHDIFINENPILFYTRVVYKNEDTPIMVVY